MKTLIEIVFAHYKEMRASYQKQIEMLASGQMTTRTNGKDTTAESLADARRYLAKAEKILAEVSAKWGLE